MNPVMFHADGTVCCHPGTPEAAVGEENGPRCPAGIQVTHVQLGNRVLTLAEAADAFTQLGDALGEAVRPLAEFTRQFMESMTRAAQAWLDQQRPLFEVLGRLAQDPAVRAYVEARERGEIPAPEPRRPCHCFCGRTHPGDPGVCDGEAITTRHYETRLLGPVDMASCAPCAAAQFIAEMT